MLSEYLLYYVVRAARNMKENRFLTVITVAVITVSLLLFSCFLLLYHNLQRSVETWGQDVQISAYLKDEVSEGRAKALIAQFKKMPEVAEAYYISKDEAMKRFSSNMEGVSGLVEDLGSNPLPASIELKLHENQRSQTILRAFVKGMARPEFEDIDYSQEWVEKFHRFLKLVRWSGIGLGSLLAAASIFIISQTLRLGFFARRDEFEILELVGATPAFIRIPFVLEGVFQGLTGALAAEGLLYVLFRALSSQLNGSLQQSLGAISIQFLPTDDLGAIVLAGMLLGLVGSVMSVRKVVRVSA